MNRRHFFFGTALLTGISTLWGKDGVTNIQKGKVQKPYLPVNTLNGHTATYTIKDGVKEFHLTASPIKAEFAPGFIVNCWGYNGSTPGPTIELIEGDKVRIIVTNNLPENHAVHWHGLILPCGMDGVGGLTQPHIPPGDTCIYEFTAHAPGTYMYHPHSDDMFQVAMGLMGMIIIHPKNPYERPVDRDYCIMLGSWDIDPGTYTPKTSTMTEFNTWTFNSRVFPGIDSMVAKKGERIRIRFGNLTMTNHPIHLHGYTFTVTGTDGGWKPLSAQYPEVTVDVPPGAMRVIEFNADYEGDWAFHCHKLHHTMGVMAHNIPNMTGVKQDDLTKRISKLLPNYHYMSMGENGMGEMADMSSMMPLPENTIPMMNGEGPFGPIEMGGMFTTFKVRTEQKSGDYSDPGWYNHPPGTTPKIIKKGS